MEMVIWLDVINGPVLILVRQVARWKLIQADLSDLTRQSHHSLEEEEAPEPLTVAIVSSRLEDAGDKEPDVVGQVPWLVEAVIFFAPRPDVIEHENVP